MLIPFTKTYVGRQSILTLPTSLVIFFLSWFTRFKLQQQIHSSRLYWLSCCRFDRLIMARCVNSDSSVGHPSLVEMTAKYLSGEHRNSSTRALLIVILLIRRRYWNSCLQMVAGFLYVESKHSGKWSRTGRCVYTKDLEKAAACNTGVNGFTNHTTRQAITGGGYHHHKT